MLANLAGGNPRLRCVPNYRAAVAHTAIRSAARHFYQPDSAHAVPLLAPTPPLEVPLGRLGACLRGCRFHIVHHGAANLLGAASGKQGAQA